ncbi:MAG: hypothetical protein QOE45_2841 [Frankiaceae bacterium]|jgi:hypothetical protein|nr:hypothetical protein [Frankiaceae bacterium]
MVEPKGRPTPKRSEVRQARKKPLVQPRRGSRSGTRSGSSGVRVSGREAMRTGDERNYPPMAAGPERAVVRDVVDGRRSFGWLAIPGWFVGLALTVTPLVAARALGSLVFPVVIAVIVLDSLAASRAVRRALDERWPDGTDVRRRTLVWYGVARNTQFRRQRLPRPKVWRGEPVA